MPKIGQRETFDLQTKDRYTKCECEIGVTVNGRELPNNAIVGEALDKAVEAFQAAITEAYNPKPKEVEPEKDGNVVPVAVVPEPAQPVAPAVPSF